MAIQGVIHIENGIFSFPAPLEVDRYLYAVGTIVTAVALLFPAPPEVNRGLYSVFILFWPK